MVLFDSHNPAEEIKTNQKYIKNSITKHFIIEFLNRQKKSKNKANTTQRNTTKKASIKQTKCHVSNKSKVKVL